MKLYVIIRLAFANLWSHKTRTFLTVAGVTIGISAIIFLVSLGYGLEELVTNQVANFDAFTIVDIPSSDTGKLKINQETMDRISQIPHIQKYSPVCNFAGRINKVDNQSTAETVVMAAGDDYYKMANFSCSSGNLPSANNEIAINESAAKIIDENLENIVGRDIIVEVIIPESMRSSESTSQTKDIRLKVTGIIDYATSPVIATNMGLMQELGVNSFSSLKLRVDDVDNVAQVRSSIEGFGFATEYVGDTLDEINRVFSLFRIILLILGLIVLVVAALGTFNTLTISLLERTKEIGLFKAIGMRNKDIYLLFLTEAMLIALMGGILGMIFGLALGHGINQIVRYLAMQSNTQALNLFVTPYLFAIAVGMFSLVIGFLTGFYPSIRAVKIDPLDAMKYE